MAAVLALLNYVVSVLLSLLGITQSRADQITVNKILAILTDPVVGLNALHGELTTVLADLSSIQGDVLALGAPQQSGSPVTLPTVPPSGYGGASADDAAAAVWHYENLPDGISGIDLGRAGLNLYGYLSQSIVVPITDDPHFFLRANWGGLLDVGGTDFSEFTVATMLPTDASILDWLNRAYPTFTWFTDTDSAHGAQIGLPGSDYIAVYCLMSPQEFLWLRAAAGGVLPGETAPVWPGIANVTLGAAHAMVPPGEQITVDCDGVIIDITGVPPWAGNFSFGTAISWRNVGAVTFTTDNGQEEFAQTFSWSSGVYLPKSQARAAGYAYRAAVGVSGTITPFTVN